MDKEGVAYIDSGILLSHKTEGNNAIRNHMDGPGDEHTKASRERQVSYGITHMWNLVKRKKDYIKKLIYRTGRDSQT